MRKHAIVCAIVVTMLFVCSCAAADLSGKWKGEYAMDSGKSLPLVFTFQQDGTRLTGSLTLPQGAPYEISEGKIDGDKINFVVWVGEDEDVKLIHAGTISGDEIKLQVYAEGAEESQVITLKRG